jgi:hypothetical protein
MLQPPAQIPVEVIDNETPIRPLGRVVKFLLLLGQREGERRGRL